MRRVLVPVALLCLLLASSTAAYRPKTPFHDPCHGQRVTAKEFRAFSSKVWTKTRWRREAPRLATIAAYHRKLTCSAGPGNRQAMQERWDRDRSAFYKHRHRERYCRSGTVITGRVSYFGGGLEASGHYTSEPGIALNINPGTDSGWNNSTTRGWLASSQRFRVKILGYGHAAVLPVTDLGPAGFVGRAADITEGGVPSLGLSTSSFPTDAVAVAKLIPNGCG